MNETSFKNNKVKKIVVIIFEYLFVGLINVILAMTALELWGKSISVPWTRGGDGDFNLIMIRAIERTGWIFHNPHLGAPEKSQIYDVPQGGENLQWFTMKVIGTFTTAPQTLNIYFLLTFMFTAMAAYGAAKWWGLSRSTSFVIATLYTFISYHFFRNEHHIFLSMYATIPLVLVYACKSVAGKVTLSRWKWVLFVVVASSTQSYYTVFSLLLIASACGFNLVRRNHINLRQHLLLIVSIFTLFIINLLPSILYILNNGRNKVAGVRNYDDSESYGLQIINLFAPRSGHRIGLLDRIGNSAANAGLRSEQGQSIGIVAAVGVAALLLYGLYKIIRSEVMMERFQYPFVLVASIMFLTVSSGFVLLGGIIGLNQIRSWNRVVVIIAFIGLLCVGYFLEMIIKKKAWTGVVPILLMVCILSLGLFDQTSPDDAFPVDQIAVQQKSDCDLIKSIQARKPNHKNVFQFPFVSYPEAPPMHNLGHYVQGLHTMCDSNFHFSFGAMKGRDDDLQRRIGLKGTCENLDDCAKIDQISQPDLRALHRAQFSVIIVYRHGYPDLGRRIETQLTKQFGDPIVSDDQSQVAFIIDADSGVRS